MDNTDKSLEELKAAIASDQEAEAKATTSEDSDPKDQEASDTTETTSKEASTEEPVEKTPEPDEWLIPGKARTKEDLVKLYSDAESYIGRQGSEIQKLRTAITEPPKRGESSEEKAVRLARFAAELTNDPEMTLVEKMRRVVREETSKDREIAKTSEFSRAYMERKKDAEFAELEPIMTQIATQYGDMIMANGMQNDPRLLDILHMAAKGVKANELASKAKADGVKKGEEKARQKGKAKIEGSSGSTKTKKLDISKLSASEMKAAFKKGDLDINE